MKLRINIRHYLTAKVKSARTYIYQFGRSIGSKFVEDLLKETSSVPTIVYELPFILSYLVANYIYIEHLCRSAWFFV